MTVAPPTCTCESPLGDLFPERPCPIHGLRETKQELDRLRSAARGLEVTHRFVIPGDPVPEERVRGRVGGKCGGKHWVIFYPGGQTKKGQKAVREAWEESGLEPLESGVPLFIRCTFAFIRPSGHYGTGRNAGTVKESKLNVRPGAGGTTGDGHRTGADFDNLVKLVCDALNGLAYPDDGQICDDGGTRKLYVDQAGVAEPQTIVELGPASPIYSAGDNPVILAEQSSLALEGEAEDEAEAVLDDPDAGDGVPAFPGL